MDLNRAKNQNLKITQNLPTKLCQRLYIYFLGNLPPQWQPEINIVDVSFVFGSGVTQPILRNGGMTVDRGAPTEDSVRCSEGERGCTNQQPP